MAFSLPGWQSLSITLRSGCGCVGSDGIGCRRDSLLCLCPVSLMQIPTTLGICTTDTPGAFSRAVLSRRPEQDHTHLGKFTTTSIKRFWAYQTSAAMQQFPPPLGWSDWQVLSPNNQERICGSFREGAACAVHAVRCTWAPCNVGPVCTHNMVTSNVVQKWALGTECTNWVMPSVCMGKALAVFYGQLFGGHLAYLDACAMLRCVASAFRPSMHLELLQPGSSVSYPLSPL